MDQILNEAKRLWECGFAIHWLKPKSKIPFELGWTKGERASWDKLEKGYRAGYNVGVKLGSPSILPHKLGFLGVIDIDVKSTLPIHRKEVEEKLLEIFFLEDFSKTPTVTTGRGNGSRHIYVRTLTPIRPKRLAQSPDRVEVKIDGKIQTRAAWEISLMGSGQQVVLPPSIHPDTLKRYEWQIPLRSAQTITILDCLLQGNANTLQENSNALFTPVAVDLIGSSLSDWVVDLILTGKNSKGDRSEELFIAAKELLKAGFSDQEVVSVLTDRSTYLGEGAWDKGRKGPFWLQKYPLERAKNEVMAARIFAGEVKIEVPLTDPEAALQEVELLGESDWRTKLALNQFGKPKQCFINAVKIFEGEFGKALFHKDEFSLRRTYGMDTPWGGKKGRELNDDDLVEMRRFLAERWRLDSSERDIVDTIKSISSRNSHHPVREYLDGLKGKWDGTARIDTWLRDLAGVDAPEIYLRAISRKILCAMVARAYHPGTIFQYALILEGPNQGEGKSRAIRALAGPDWFGTVRFDMDHKDFVLALQGRWCTEISELSGLGRRNTNFIKAIISEESDRIRHPYGRFTETLPRQGVFIGTTNHFQYLEDETGNRRFWPVRVGGQVNVEGIAAIRDQLFAEAKVTWEQGEKLYLTKEEERAAREVQRSRMTEDSWEEALVTFLKEDALKPESERVAAQGLRMRALFQPFGPFAGEKDSEPNIKRAARSLRKMGFHPINRKEDGHVFKIWAQPGATDATN